MLKDVTILGGFDGVDWSVQDPATNATVIDCAAQRRGVITGKTAPSDPQYTRLRMEGFTIRNCRAAQESGEVADDEFGGGLRAKFADLVLRDMVFDQNTAESPPNQFAGGGGLSVQSNSSQNVTLERLTFTNNQAIGGGGVGDLGASLGGGMFIERASLVSAFDLRFESNTASNAGGRSLGGGAHITFGTTGTLEKVAATDNVAVGTDAFGGALFLEGDPDPSSPDRTQITVLEGDFRNNASRAAGLAEGGAIVSFNASAALRRLAVFDNVAEGNPSGTQASSAAGGGVFFEASTAGQDPVFEIRNAIVAKNVTTGATGGGAGLGFLGADVAVEHTTLSENRQTGTSGFGNGILATARAGAPGRPGSLTLSYSLITSHTTFPSGHAVFLNRNGALEPVGVFDRNQFAGNSNDICPPDPTFCSSQQTINLNNLFDGPTLPTFFVDPMNSDFHIDGTTPPTNEATASAESTDFDGAGRDVTPDIGADEFGATANRLTVRKQGTGTGTVSSNPTGIDCGLDCTEVYQSGALAELTALPDLGISFGGFGGNPDCSDGMVTVDVDKQCDAVFAETPPGVVIVEKQTNPDGRPETFQFGGSLTGTIGDNQQLQGQVVSPGAYAVTETDHPLFTLTAIVCDDANSTGDTGSLTATFMVEAGETVKCTFTNSLTTCSAPDTDLVLPNETADDTRVVQACNSITAGPYTVGATGDVTFESLSSSLRHGFSVIGTFNVINNVP